MVFASLSEVSAKLPECELRIGTVHISYAEIAKAMLRQVPSDEDRKGKQSVPRTLPSGKSVNQPSFGGV